MHTALPIPINGQLTYALQEFFDEEAAAIAKAAKAIAEFAVRSNGKACSGKENS